MIVRGLTPAERRVLRDLANDAVPERWLDPDDVGNTEVHDRLTAQGRVTKRMFVDEQGFAIECWSISDAGRRALAICTTTSGGT